MPHRQNSHSTFPTSTSGQPHTHPFLQGNFAPVEQELISHPCKVVYGEIPVELLGGQYIRNGGNPVHPPEQGRHYHWFDGDGMLHGVLFPPPSDPTHPPLYTNRHLATPLLTLTLVGFRSPIPSIALLISPLSSIHRIIAAIVQAFLVAVRARLGVLSVANTNVVWWGHGLGSEAAAEDAELSRLQYEKDGRKSRLGDRRDEELKITSISEQSFVPDLKKDGCSRQNRKDHRLLALCESGPPLEVRVPELETIGWDRLEESSTGESLSTRRGSSNLWARWGLPRVQEDWMTAHPRIDPVDGSLLFYSTQMFDSPHVRYSVIDRKGKHLVWKKAIDVGRAKMMHDFAATRRFTILLNLPLTLSPANLFGFKPNPLIYFDRNLPSEFIIFPRLLGSSFTSQKPIRYVDPEPSLIFHTANAWDEYVDEQVLEKEGRIRSQPRVVAVNLVAPRFKSAKLVYAAGAIDVPLKEKEAGIDDVVLLYYYRFLLPDDYHSLKTDQDTTQTQSSDTQRYGNQGQITHMFPLTAIPFEFPTIPESKGMSECRYVYGCTMTLGSFDERLGGAAKVDCLAKIDVQELIKIGKARVSTGYGEGGMGSKSLEPVDGRTAQEIIDDWGRGVKGAVELFPLPKGWYAQEMRFIPRSNGEEEDDGYLVCYVYDESYILPDGTPSKAPDAGSELWVIDAKRMGDGMSAVTCRIKLPQRVPYGLHGTWIPPSLACQQRSLQSLLAPQPLLQEKLAKSRLSHFVSILLDRPSERNRSGIERCFLVVFWPVAVGMLILALTEAIREWVSIKGDSTLCKIELHKRSWIGMETFPWPQALSAVLIIGIFYVQYDQNQKRVKLA